MALSVRRNASVDSGCRLPEKAWTSEIDVRAGASATRSPDLPFCGNAVARNLGQSLVPHGQADCPGFTRKAVACGTGDALYIGDSAKGGADSFRWRHRGISDQG